MCEILRRRLDIVVLKLIGEYQSGFVANRGTTDSIFAYQRICEILRDREQTLHTAFIDFRKAFDSVNFTLLFTILKCVGVPEQLVDLIESLYSDANFKVRLDDGHSDVIHPVVGVRQGCILSPLLFIVFLDTCLKLVTTVDTVGLIAIDGMLLEVLGYADGLAWMNTHESGLQDRLTLIDSIFRRVGMLLSVEKTETMTHEFDPVGYDVTEFSVNGTVLKDSSTFPYLGSSQNKLLSTSDTIKFRMSKASGAFHALSDLWKRPLKLHVKGLIFDTLVRGVLLHGSETWVTKASDIRMLETFEMSCVRTILRVSKLEHIRSIDLRRRLRLDAGIEECVVRSRLRYFGHVVRLGPDTMLYKLAFCEESHQTVGRPLKTWLTCIREDLKYRRIEGIETAKHLVKKGRDSYRNRVVYDTRPP